MEIFVARQPIFDRENRVAGYELLYRSDIRSIGAATPGADRSEMSNLVIANAFLGIGLHRLTNGTPAFLNCSRELLLGPTIELLDPKMVVVEILEDVEPDEAVVDACRRLVEAGYRIALDDFVFSERYEPLLGFAHVVKLDVLEYTPAELEALVARLRSSPAKLLAEKVETRELHEHCMKLGFELFQGYFYSRPETLARPDLTVHHLGLLRLLNLLRDLDTSATELEEAFRSDLPLSYKLMRIANSAAFGNTGIHSIGHAIQLLGREPLYRWLALLLITSVGRGGGLDRELVRTVLVRARFCELISEMARRRAVAGSLFLVGLFSLLDAVLGQTMEEALSQLALTPPVELALLRREGPLAPTLKLVESYEIAEWDRVAALCPEAGISSEQLPALYLQALAWAQDRLNDPEL
jgi:EAL and modified HD-GYP domain-containing signal transduction protein